MDLSSLRQVQPILPSSCPEFLDCALSLLAGDALGFAADHAVNALAVDHDVDAVAEIAIWKTLGRDAMFGEAVPGFQCAERRTGETTEFQGHRSTLLVS